MTAEVGILNRNGIALAADSAVTTSTEKGDKIFNSANKLLALSTKHPIGIMVYDSGLYMGVPWETVIKLYRGKLGDTSFDTLHEYCEDFLKFLQETPSLTSFAVELNIVIQAFNPVFLDILNAAGSLPATRTEKDINDIIEKRINDHLSRVISLPFASGFDQGFISDFFKLFGDDFVSRTTNTLNFTMSDDNALGLLFLAAHLVSKATLPTHTGVVIAGYGESELLPSLYSFSVEGRLLGRFVYKELQAVNIKAADGPAAAIVPFAQQDVVMSLLTGIDPGMENEITRSVQTILKALPQDVLNVLQQNDPGVQITSAVQQQFDDRVNLLVNWFSQALETFAFQNHIKPMTDTIAILPKEELAFMAETLVSLTSFKRKVTGASETVGGPVDVAVITKGDGFIWMKRKHYFEPQLNQHFFKNRKG